MTAFRNSYGYDANGNQVTRNGNTLTYASYNLPTWIGMGTNSSTLSYGAWRNLTRQVAISAAGAETTIYVAGLLEKVTRGGTTEYRHLIRAIPGTVAVYIRSSAGSNLTYYLHRDHLGSPELITDSAGAAVVQLSFSAYGERRDADWEGPISSAQLALAAGVTRHGYTDHQELDSVNLIHMNGRVYDPLIGRFQTRDPYIDGIDSSQGPNGYAYVWNNPLSRGDPSGFGDQTCIRNPNAVVTVCGKGPQGGNSSGFGHMVSGVGGGSGGHSHANMGGPWPFVEDNNGMENVIVTARQDQPPPSSPYTAIGLQSTKCVGSPFSSFFANNYGPASNVGSQYNVDPSLLLGLAAAESGYGTSSMATTQNNPFGATPGGFSTPGVTYDSYASAWRNWGSQWGPRVNNVGNDVSQFINSLTLDNQGVVGGSDTRGPYNTQNAATGGNPNWANLVSGAISGVQRRLPVWQKSGC